MAGPSLVDRVLEVVAPGYALRRQAARAAGRVVRNYEAAAVGRRTSHWHRAGGDANTSIRGALAYIRNTSRHLVRNNGYAESALGTIADHMVGTGITPKPRNRNRNAREVWREWSGVSCDADGVNDWAGIQGLAARTIAESGEVLLRKRWRRMSDGFPIPLQIQVLEPDYLDTTKDRELPNGGRIVQGVEFDALGRRVAYWLYREHPGAALRSSLAGWQSTRVPASDVLHVFKSTRAGQARAVSWFAPVLLTMQDLGEYSDAALMKAKIAACLAVLVSDSAGDETPLGTSPAGEPMVDTLEPGMITRIGAGQSVEVVQPPNTTDFAPFQAVQLRQIATGLGITYEDLTGDYTGMPYSAARMSRLRHWARVEGWRWRMLIPRLCDPVWAWVMEAAIVAGRLTPADVGPAEWTAPPLPMLDADKEVSGIVRRIRAGLISWDEAVRELGFDPDELMQEIAAGNRKRDALGLVLVSDPRLMSDQGQIHTAAAAPAAPPTESAPPATGDDNDPPDDPPDDGGDPPDDGGDA